MLRGWKESPGHNKNLLLGDAQEMGLALVQDPEDGIQILLDAGDRLVDVSGLCVTVCSPT